MRNREVAELFYEVADILEYQQVEWKPRAYRKAAQMIENLGKDIETIYAREGKAGLTRIPGVGGSIADHIAEYLKTGRVEKFEKLKGKAPSGAAELMEIRGLGAKKMKKLADALGIRTRSLPTGSGGSKASEKNLKKTWQKQLSSMRKVMPE